MKSGLELISAERLTHSSKGFTTEHDDVHDDGEIALAALAYVGHAAGMQAYIKAESDEHSADPVIVLCDPWPWDRSDDKRRHYAASNTPILPRKLTRAQRIELLTIAGALIAAEIDRINRVTERITGSF